MSEILNILSEKTNKLAVLEGTAHTYEPGLVSVVIPNYNKGKYIAQCLDSLLLQDYIGVIEIIVVDDCSDDDSVEVLSEALRSPEAIYRRSRGRMRVHCMQLPKRVGTAWAQNIGFYLAKGEFIANQDSDDMSAPDRITKQVNYLRENPEVDAVGTDYIQFVGYPSVPSSTIVQKPTAWLAFDVDTITKAYEAHTHRVCWGTLMMRASVINLTGGNNKKYIGAEDFEIVHRMVVDHKLKVAAISEKLYYYRKSATQRSALFHGV